MTTKVNEKVIAQDDIQALEQLYALKDKETVIEYLLDYYFLMPILLEAPAQIAKYFPGRKLSLSVTNDPEIANYEQLWVGIDATNDEPEELLDKLDQLRHDWAHKALHRIGRKNRWRLNFSWDFSE